MKQESFIALLLGISLILGFPKVLNFLNVETKSWSPIIAIIIFAIGMLFMVIAVWAIADTIKRKANKD